MRLGSVFKMRISILNTATTEQMGYIIFFFFRLLPNLQLGGNGDCPEGYGFHLNKGSRRGIFSYGEIIL